jgi:hypothetical protein
VGNAYACKCPHLFLKNILIKVALKFGIIKFVSYICISLINKQKINVMSKSTKAPVKRHKLTVKQFVKTLPKDLGVVAKIVKTAKRGYTQKQIIEAGFNKNTVYRQVREQVLNA